MENKLATVDDIGTDHDGFPATKITTGSPNVFINGKPAARVGDKLEGHAKPGVPSHSRVITKGSSSVFINGIPAAITGSSINCGGSVIGSSHVIIGDQAPPASPSSIEKKEKDLYNRRLVLIDHTFEAPMPHTAYKLIFSDGEEIQGITNEKGETAIINSAQQAKGFKIQIREG